MPSQSPERGRPRDRGHSSAFAKEPEESPTRSAPRQSSFTTRSNSRSSRGGYRREGVKDRDVYSRSRSRSRSGSRRRRSYSRSQSRSPVPRSSKIIVEKLTRNVNEAHLREIFGSYGEIQELDLPMNKQFNTNRGSAYIIYKATPDAQAAIAHMHEAQLDGAIITVSIVLPRRKFSQSPPPSRQAPPFDRRGPPPPSYGSGYGRGQPPGNFGPPGGGRYRSPPGPRRPSPGRRYMDNFGGRDRDRDPDTYRPRSYSRSRTPRSRSLSYSSRSRSRSPPRRGGGGDGYRRRDSPPRRGGGGGGGGGGRRRSPSYSSYSSYSDRSRSRSRGYRRR